MDQEVLEQLKERLESLQKQFKAAAEAEKPQVLEHWKRAISEFADAVLRDKPPSD